MPVRSLSWFEWILRIALTPSISSAWRGRLFAVLLALTTSAPVSAVVRDWDGGGTSNRWSDNFNWSGNTLPGPNDTALLIDDGDTIADTSFNIDQLQVFGNSSVRNSLIGTIFQPVNSFSLTVDDMILQNTAGSPTADLFIDGISSDHTGLNVRNDVELRDGSRLLMTSLGSTRPARTRVGQGQLLIAPGGTLVGNGELNFGKGNQTITRLVNDGLLQVRGLSPFSNLEGNASPSKLTIQEGFSPIPFPAFHRLDLDGASETGVVHLDNRATLDISLDIEDFDGTLILDSESVFDSVLPWSHNGTIKVNTEPGAQETGPPGFNTAVIRGESIEMFNAIVLLDEAANDRLRIESYVTMTGVTVGNYGHITLAGGGFLGIGTNIDLAESGSELVIEGPELLTGLAFTATGSGQMRVAAGGNFQASSTSFADPTVDARFRNEGITQVSLGSNSRLSNLVVDDFVQVEGGTLRLNGELYDSGPGFGQVSSMGTVELAGDLVLKRAGDFIPAVNDIESLIHAVGTITGAFDSVDATAFADLGLDVELEYLPGSVSARFVELAYTADFDNDFDVDGRDYIIWQRGESPNPYSKGDLELWQTQYANIEASGLSSSRAVPEPTSLLLVMFCVIPLTLHRHSVALDSPQNRENEKW